MFKIVVLLLFSIALYTTVSGQAPRKFDNAKLLAETEPAALPQSPVAADRPSTDLKDDGLKGPVKRVTEYCQGTIFSETEFNEAGNRVREIQYDHGRLIEVTVYGYVDGMRVRRTGYPEWAGGNEPDPPAWKNEPPRDKRYSDREVRKYDDSKRLIEHVAFLNNGERWFRTSYSYDGYIRTSRNYDKNDSVSSTTFEKLDSNGHVVEVSKRDGLNDGKKWVSVYRLDSLGNWIAQNEHMETTDDKGRKQSSEGCTRTRTISYFEELKTPAAPK